MFDDGESAEFGKELTSQAESGVSERAADAADWWDSIGWEAVVAGGVVEVDDEVVDEAAGVLSAAEIKMSKVKSHFNVVNLFTRTFNH